MTSSAEPTVDDVRISATLRDFTAVERLLRSLRARSSGETSTIVDLGCGTGYLTIRCAEILGATTAYGADADATRLAAAADRGVRTMMVDLNTADVPLDDGVADVVTSFGVLAYLPLYDGLVDEASRLLRPGGWFVVSLPNLGSYTNRLALLFGFQPREVEISERVPAGIIRFQRAGAALPNLGAHLHAATLRAMRELLAYNALDVVEVLPLSPRFGRPLVRMADVLFGRFPSWSRRFVILARKRG